MNNNVQKNENRLGCGEIVNDEFGIVNER